MDVNTSLRRTGSRVRGLGMVLLLLAPAAVRADDLEQFEKLKAEFEAHHAAGRLRQAEPLALRMVETAQKSLPDRPALLAASLHCLGVLHRSQGRYRESETALQRCLAIREKHLGPEHADVAATLYNLGAVLRALGRIAEAESLLRRSLTIHEKVLPDDHPNRAFCLAELGGLCANQGRYDEAESLLRQALAVREKALGPNHRRVAQSLERLGELYVTLGRYDEAEDSIKRCIRIHLKASKPNEPDLAAALNGLGRVYALRGRFAEAETLYRRALAIRRRILGTDHPALASSLNNLGVVYQAQGRSADAEKVYRQALAIREKFFGPDHTLVAQTLQNLAVVAGSLKKYDEAQQLFQRALAMLEKNLGPHHPDVAFLLGNLAELCKNLRRYEEAEKLLKRAIAIRQQAMGTEHPELAASLNNLADLYGRQHRYAEAIPLVDRAIAIRDRAHASPGERSRSYFIGARLSWYSGNRRQALARLRQSMDLAEQQRGEASGGESERATLFGRFLGIYERMVAWQAELGDVAEAWAAAERGRARSLLDQMDLQGVDLLAGVPEARTAALRRRDAEARTRVAMLEKQLSLAQQPSEQAPAERRERLEQLQAALAKARDAVVQVYRDLRSASPAYRLAVGQDFQPVSLQVLQPWVAQQQALLLEYVLGQDGGYLLVVPAAGDARLVKLDISAEDAAALGVEPGPLTAGRLRAVMSVDGRELLELLADPKRSSEATRRLAALWKIVVPEAQREALTSGRVKRLIVVPDGCLALLPLEALVVATGEQPRYLLDSGPPVIYGPSATILYNLATRTKPQPASSQPAVLSVADPDYPEPAAPASAGDAGDLRELAPEARMAMLKDRIARLPYSGLESRWVAEAFAQQGLSVTPLVQREATEGNLRRSVARRSVLHLACHGLADDHYGNLFGALALAPGPGPRPQPADDGFLTLAEIYELDLSGCELAILSACQTNYGPQQQGEGVWALSRGFLVAGARRVAASNWLIDDEAAASLVGYYCSGIAQRQKRDVAVDYAELLHRARRWVRQQEKWRNPYYWAAFVMIGPA